MKLSLIRTISGRELEHFLKKSSDDLLKHLETGLAEYDGVSVGLQWKELYRWVEEFVNLFEALNFEGRVLISRIKLGDSSFTNPQLLVLSLKRINEVFGNEVGLRLYRFFSLFYETNIDTVGTLYEYCKSRRLHIASMLYLIPMYAKGNKKINDEDLITELSWCIDKVAVPVTTAFNAMLQSRCLPDFEAVVKSDCLKFNSTYTQLEDEYLEPVRLSDYDLHLYGKGINTSLLKCPKVAICSREEFECNLHNMSVYYAAFGIVDNPVFIVLKSLAEDVLPFMEDNYSIAIPESDFRRICKKYTSLKLYKNMNGFFEVAASRYPFFRIGDTYYSSILFFQRYIVNTVQNTMRRKKKFQIDSGFIFEKKVIALVRGFGFEYHKECKRIGQHEFDVVCVKDGCIYNFQCKNNYINVSDIDTDKVNVASRYHRLLGRYYDTALKKEDDREDVLKDFLKLDKAKHFVVSRYPVICSNPRSISYNRLRGMLASGHLEKD